MSNVFDALAWAIKVSRGEPMPARMLLIVGLAQRVGDRDDGFVVWPSLKQLCEDTDMSRTSVKKWTRHLETIGLVEVFQSKRDNGASGSNRYRLPIKMAYFHPTKGLVGEGSQSDRGVGRNPTGEGSVDSTGEGSPARPPKELPSEHPLEDRDSELPLGLEPIPPKEPTPHDLALFIASEWVTRAHATPLRGGWLTAERADKAFDLAKKFAIDGQTAIDVWAEIFARVDESDFLQGKVPGRDGRPPFRLTVNFLLEKRNFEKTLEGRFNGKSSGERRLGSTSEATGRVLARLRSGPPVGERGGDSRRALARG